MAYHTIDLPCIASTWFDSANPNTSHGTDLVLQCGDYASRYMLIALRFNTSLIPAGKRIVSAVLNYYVTSNFSDQILYRYITSYESWTEDSTYNTSSIVNAFNPGPTVNYTAGSYQQLTLSPRFAELGPNGIALQVGGMNKTLSIQSRRAANPPFITVVYEDVPPSAPTPKSPIGVYKDSRSVTRFEWQYNSDVGGTQKAFDLQWSTDQVNWTTVSQTTANNYYDMPADTLPAGNIYWRVRTYNEYDEVGPYSDIQSFYVIGAPADLTLNAIPTNTARPVVSWSAFNQQVYQLQVLSGDTVVYDSGEQPGINIRQHKIKAWLEDGEYTVRLRIKNEYGLWSDWDSTTVTISTDKPEKPSIALQRSAYGVEITGTGLVYRSDYDKDEYICIGMADGSYFDNAVRSKVEYKYFIRAVSENDTYNDSDIKFIQAELRHALIAPVSDLSNVFAFTRSLNLPPKRTYNHQPGGAFVEYAGRKHPVWEPTEHVSAGWTMTFYLKSWAEVEAFVALVDRKETVLYRDARGRKVYGILSNLTIDDERSGYIVSFTLTEVDYIEGVDV